jgi:ATP-binding protein involved in chromosome partitioning
MGLPIYNAKDDKPLDRVKNIVAVAAGKGGVGKSTVAVNLALALQHQGFKVGILDSDLYGPSIRKMLPEDQPPGKKGDYLTPAICQGITVMSMAYFRQPGEATVVRAPIANNIINQFLHHVLWGQLDYLLIDFPPGTGDIQLTLSQQANLTGAVIVTTPQQVAVLDVRKAMHMFEQLNLPIIGVIENMSAYYPPNSNERISIFGSGGGRRLAEESGVPFLGEVPIDPEICKFGDEGIPLIPKEDPPATTSVKAFLAIANNVVTEIAALKEQSEDSMKNFELTWKEM